MFFSRNSKDGCDCSLKVVMDVPGLQSRPCNYQLWQSPYCRRGRCVCRRQGELFVIVTLLINRPFWMSVEGKTACLCYNSQRPKINLLECIYMRVELHNANTTYVTRCSFMWQISICVIQLWFESRDLRCWLTYSLALLRMQPRLSADVLLIVSAKSQPQTTSRSVNLVYMQQVYSSRAVYRNVLLNSNAHLHPVDGLQRTCKNHNTDTDVKPFVVSEIHDHNWPYSLVAGGCKQRVNSMPFCSQKNWWIELFFWEGLHLISIQDQKYGPRKFD